MTTEEKAAALATAEAPILWEYNGAKFCLAKRSIDTEILFQAQHESGILNRHEARRGKISPQGYAEGLQVIHEALAANRYCFGGSISLEYLTTPEGMVKYVHLLAQEGHPQLQTPMPFIGKHIETAARENSPEWRQLKKDVLRRDFTDLFFAMFPAEKDASASSEAGGQKPSTSAAS